jgi:hypothetical protein
LGECVKKFSRYLEKGGKMIVPVPKIEVYESEIGPKKTRCDSAK